MEKVVVGLSGGVDSAVCAYLLTKEGYDVCGVTVKQFDNDEAIGMIKDARAVADYLGIPHYVYDFTEEFRQEVMTGFVCDYINGRTPNPCVNCNRIMKWQALLDYADEIGASKVATGHYAQVLKLQNGRFTVKNAASAKKDQTYVLYQLSQEQLSRTLMPLGKYSKEEVRKMAAEAKLPVASKPDSQDICFVPDGDYAGFIGEFCDSRLIPPEYDKKAREAFMPGNFVDKNGKILGEHKGIVHYTIGQRKGLGIAMGHPVFVSEIRTNTREVVLCDDEDIISSELVCGNIYYMGSDNFNGKNEIFAKIRYSHKGEKCKIKEIGDELHIYFDNPVRAITPGQSVVFYDEGCVLGGGIILR